MIRLLNKAAVLLVGATALAASAGDVYVISHPGTTIAAADVRDVFVGEKQFAGSTKLVTVDNSAAQADMLSKVIKIEAKAYDALWTKKAFRDGASPPAVKGSDIEVVEFVKRTAGAVGYVSTSPNGVNIVHKY